MFVLRAKLLHIRITANACRTYSERPETPKYWHAKFTDGKPRSFDEMPTVEVEDAAKFNPYKQHEIYPQWFQKYGYVVRQPVGDGKYCVHLFHFDDFETVHKGDSIYRRTTRKAPERLSHGILKVYREKNKDLYDNIGLGPGDGDYVWRIRDMLRNSMSTKIDEKLEKVSDDLIEIIRAEVGEGREIDLLPWLFRWGFENVGLKFLDKRLGALSQTGNEQADKMVEAAATTNEMVALTTLEPFTDYEKRYQKMESSEGYFYSVLKKYIDEIALESDSKCAVRKIMESNPKDAITVTLDGFQGALQTVPLSVLMALYNLSRNKDVQAEARAEVKHYLPTKDSKYCTSHVIPDIVEHIVWETLRYSPPIIGHGRVIKSDMVLGGYHVPRQTNIILHIQVANKNEEFYEDPLKFNPNRFKLVNPNRVKKLFGMGSLRACIGFTFAHDTMSLILLKMLRNFEFTYDGGEISMINRLHNEPEEPLFLKLKPLPE